MRQILASSQDGLTVAVEIGEVSTITIFTTRKPSEKALSLLRATQSNKEWGFRWKFRERLWSSPLTPEAMAFARDWAAQYMAGAYSRRPYRFINGKTFADSLHPPPPPDGVAASPELCDV